MHGRALVVDDHPGTRAGLARQLRRAGWLVEEEGDGRSALTALATDVDVDVVVLDVNLPGLSGPQVARQLKDAGHPAAIVLVSTVSDAEGHELSRSAGARGFLSKDDFSPARMMALLASVA